MLTRVKGTQDLLNLTLRNFLLKKIRAHLIKYNFNEIITPIIEKVELFQRVVGSETDIVKKEMYKISSEQDKEELVLRPEMTASIVRAFLNNNIQSTPWQVFSYGPNFRYERPQKGRYREFTQISLESIGVMSPAYDAYFITMLDRFFNEQLLLDSYALCINFLGCHEDRLIYKNKLHEFLTLNESKICETCKERKEKNILRTLDCKNENCRNLYATGPKITDYLCNECKVEWDLIQEYLNELSVSYTHTPMLVRGLDYYNKIIFEFLDNGLGAQNSFCGGGRYDTVASQLGSKKDYPSIGAAIGVERILLILEQIQNKLPIEQPPQIQAILPFGQDQISVALQIADELHSNNICAQILVEKVSLKSMLRKANDIGAVHCILIGPDEQAGRYVTVKNMVIGTEEKVPQAEITNFFLKLK